MQTPYVLIVPHKGEIVAKPLLGYEDWMLKCTRMVVVHNENEENFLFKQLHIPRYKDVMSFIKELRK